MVDQASKAWVLLISSGTIIEFPVELYCVEDHAWREAERWASMLSGLFQEPFSRPFDGRWEVGELDVRLVECYVEDFSSDAEWWVGTHWTADGSPDPEAILLRGREAAREWVLVPPDDETMKAFDVDSNHISAAFGIGDDESYSVAHVAKVLRSGATHLSSVTYKLELTGTFVHQIRGEVTGRPGLSRDAIEGLVEQHWTELSLGTEVLLESSWQLNDFWAEVP